MAKRIKIMNRNYGERLTPNNLKMHLSGVFAQNKSILQLNNIVEGDINYLKILKFAQDMRILLNKYGVRLDNEYLDIDNKIDKEIKNMTFFEIIHKLTLIFGSLSINNVIDSIESKEMLNISMRIRESLITGGGDRMFHHYQRSLNQLINHCVFDEQTKKSAITIQRLVRKERPCKIEINERGILICPTCNEFLTSDKQRYCQSCGQKLRAIIKKEDLC